MTDMVKFRAGALQSIELTRLDGPPESSCARAVSREHVEELRKTLKASRHIPILVRPGAEGRFVVVDGQHRVEVARSEGWNTIDALVLACSDEDAVFLGLASNVTRKNLSSLEVQSLIQRLESAGYTSTKELAALLGMSRTRVKRARGLKKLSSTASAALRARQISDDAAHELTKLPPEKQDATLEKIKGAARSEIRAQVKAERALGSPPDSDEGSAPSVVHAMASDQHDGSLPPESRLLGGSSSSSTSSVVSDSEENPCGKVVELERKTTDAHLLRMSVGERQACLAAAMAARASLNRWIIRLERTLPTTRPAGHARGVC